MVKSLAKHIYMVDGEGGRGGGGGLVDPSPNIIETVKN